jgi:hypothetical protein
MRRKTIQMVDVEGSIGGSSVEPRQLLRQQFQNAREHWLPLKSALFVHFLSRKVTKYSTSA